MKLSEPMVDFELASSLGLAEDEYADLCRILGRDPSYTELGVTSAMWSEHCSYKSSKVYLREFPSEGKRVVQGPGENAGVVDVGHGYVAVFKMESHNHPSYIEPYQGAATGVGGILRDIFTMGARPIACMDSLRFGDIDAPRMRHLVDGVVRGIGDYGNCVGIPTVGGETGFHPSYNGNILVNAFALGLARSEAIFLAAAKGVGNPIIYAGSRTGRDGIHGATMASEAFDSESEAKRPTVQVGDPFAEKVVLEACLEAMKSDALVAVQDMGAAGITSSSFEMAGRSGLGFVLDLDQVPLREKMTPFEIMLSESQERMVMIVERGREEEVTKIFERWDLEAVKMGELTDDGVARMRWHGEVVGEMPIAPLTDAAPEYTRPVAEPADLAARQAAPAFDEPANPLGDLLKMMSTPEMGDKSWIWRQYDHTVRGNTLLGPGGDAALLRMKGTPAGLAMTSDVNPVYCYLDPRRGGMQAVAEAARNLACVGAEPVGLTDCLNFGNPENPEISWQFRECVRGISDACRALEVPVISGNVSFYNETEGVSVHPTPTIGMVGLVENIDQYSVSYFRQAGERILLLGEDYGEFGGSAFLRLLKGIEQGMPPAVDLGAEARLARLLRHGSTTGLFSTATDLSDGGLAVALAEAALGCDVGAKIELTGGPKSLFSESQARALVCVSADSVDQALEAAESAGVTAVEIGETGGSAIEIVMAGVTEKLEIDVLAKAWREALPRALDL